MTDSVNKNSVSLRFDGFSFLVNTNRSKKVRYIRVVSDMLELPAKEILFSNQVHAAVHFYEKTTRKLGGEQRLVTMDDR